MPNILLISLDDCRADGLSCYGNPRPTSPFMDGLAARGVRFSNAFVNTHGTTPSHTTMLSSLYQESHRVEYDSSDQKRLFDTIPQEVVLVQELFLNAGYVTLGVTDGGRIAKNFGFDRGFVHFTDRGRGIRSGTEKLLGLLRKSKREGTPLFLFYHTYEIHSPYEPPEEFQKDFVSAGVDFDTSSQNLLKYANQAQSLKDEELEYVKSMYEAGIRYTDEELNALFKALEEEGFFENYLVILTSDHGEEFGEHGGLMHRAFLYDELLHVPLILEGTDVPSGIVNDRLVSIVDVATTLLAYAGIETELPLEGRDLLALPATPPEIDPEEAVFAQYGNLRYAIRTREWKLIETTKTSRIELYNLLEDPGEQKNMATTMPEVRDRLFERLQAWKKDRSTIGLTREKEVSLSEEELERMRALGYIQ